MKIWLSWIFLHENYYYQSLVVDTKSENVCFLWLKRLRMILFEEVKQIRYRLNIYCVTIKERDTDILWRILSFTSNYFASQRIFIFILIMIFKHVCIHASNT